MVCPVSVVVAGTAVFEVEGAADDNIVAGDGGPLAVVEAPGPAAETAVELDAAGPLSLIVATGAGAEDVVPPPHPATTRQHMNAITCNLSRIFPI